MIKMILTIKRALFEKKTTTESISKPRNLRKVLKTLGLPKTYFLVKTVL